MRLARIIGTSGRLWSLAVVLRDQAGESVYSKVASSSRPRGATLTEPVTVERDGHVLLIGVNRPAKRNAFNLAAIDALGRAYEILGTDDELRAGVLFAHGDHFSAGLDLAEVGPAVAEHGPGGAVRLAPLRPVWRVGRPGAQARGDGGQRHRVHVVN